MARNARLEGIYVGSRSDLEALCGFTSEHQIHPVIDRVFPSAESRAAFEHLASGRHFGKVVISLEEA
jgi:NADPH:quinone reductase-like Zn-dependent oxidoreductase